MKRLDTASHINANHNRNMLKATFLFLQRACPSKEGRIRLMKEAKERIREHDAQPAAWFYGPDRADWVRARMKRGEFEGQPHEVLGRAFMGEEQAA